MTSQNYFSHKFLNNTTFVMQLRVFTFRLEIYVCSRILLYKCFVISLYTEIALANVKLCLSTNSHTHIHVDVYFVDEMKILNKATFSWNDFSYVHNANNDFFPNVARDINSTFYQCRLHFCIISSSLYFKY